MSIALLCALTLHLGTPAAADTVIRLGPRPNVDISTYLGAIHVRVGSDDRLIVQGGRVHAREGGSSASIEGDDPSRPRGGEITVTVPASAKLGVHSFNGSLSFDGTPTRLSAETVNGSIAVKGGRGSISIESVNGNITVDDFRGEELSIEATAGSVAVTGATGAIKVDAINGAIRLRDMHATSLDASSVNEVVEYSGSIDPRGSYNLESHNGGINLWLPADVSARMRVSTFNGTFSSPDIPGTTTGARAGRVLGADNGKGAKGSKGGKGNNDAGDDDGDQEFTVTFGRGDAQVTLDSFNGNITVRRLRPTED